MKRTIHLTINGDKWSADVEPNDLLLDVLRTQLGIKSAKPGCESGDCGACTILLGGKTVRSCLILAVEVDGREITTVEGLSKNGLSPVQKAFLKHDSFQCGYCAPGVVLSATELLGRNPHPKKEEVQEALAGNLCRCTGYSSIIDAVLSVSRKKAKVQRHG